IEIGQGVRDGRMNPGASLRELRRVGDFLGERMLERIDRFREEGPLVYKLPRDEAVERGLEEERVSARHPREDRQREFLAADRGRLQSALLVVAETVDARGEDSLNGRGDRQLRRVAQHPVRSAAASENAALVERQHDFFEEEGIATCPFADAVGKRTERGVTTQQITEQRVCPLTTAPNERD